MSEILKINCPECGKEFDAGTAFNAHLDNAKKEQEKKANIPAKIIITNQVSPIDIPNANAESLFIVFS